jgi:hypothetical protein
MASPPKEKFGYRSKARIGDNRLYNKKSATLVEITKTSA